MNYRPHLPSLFLALALALASLLQASLAESGVFVRFRLVDPKDAKCFVRLGGYIHKSPWYLPGAVWPEGADRDPAKRVSSSQPTPWFDLMKHAGKLLHGRISRAGGVAEFPNVTADFIVTPESDTRKVVIELASSPDEQSVVKRWEESFTGSLTSFLVSPNLKQDADSLETASEMTDRRLSWAKEASGGERVSPKDLIIQTSFWGPQRPELNLKEAEVLWLLGFNVVGNQQKDVKEKFGLRVPGHTHHVDFGPAATREEIENLMKQHASRNKEEFTGGVPYGFADEICCRPRIEKDQKALEHFHAWLAARGIPPAALGVEKLADVVPIETPEVFREREKENGPAARRVFYYTSRFRQHAGTERIRWHTEAFHKYFSPGARTSTLVADHPYFSGTGLGMGMTPNRAWGGAPLALDWFDLARSRAVDLAGIEDWMGLQYMYGPNYTWEGFQLMGFQTSIFRSGSRGQIPIIAWITPSDETNLRLKSSSALCQGAKNFFYWTYGPTATSTENYWSDLRGAYEGVVNISRLLAKAEHIIHPGKTRETKVALLYSISSDLWQPFDYVHMLERRATYLSLIHDQYLVDMLTEEDIEAGRLGGYKILYVTDPCITSKAAVEIGNWVRQGGFIYGSCAAGSRNEFNEPSNGLSDVFGIQPDVETKTQSGDYRTRGKLNPLPWVDQMKVDKVGAYETDSSFGVIGTTVSMKPTTGKVVGEFTDKKPAAVFHEYGKGRALVAAACPGLSYLKDAKFVPLELKEKYPPIQRRFINSWAAASESSRLVELSHPVVEAGVYDAPNGTALVLANFTYEPIPELDVILPVRKEVTTVRSLMKGKCKFRIEAATENFTSNGFSHLIQFKVELGLNDIIVLE
ncbi:MAG: hypothetical protein O3B01_27700 [Planctomycetota bacterium]|nr:hypothetical protein [Planctomycetota bacterium]